MSAYIVQDDRIDHGEEYLPYAYRTSHPVLRWLPTKLAEWIGANLCEELNILDRQAPLWTAAELNTIITGNLVGGHFRTFGCIQWENELFSGRPKAGCYPFNIQGHRFRHKNPQVDAVYRTRYRYHYHVAFAFIVPDIVYDIVYDIGFKKGLSFISNRQRRKEGTFCACGLDIIKLMMLLVQDCVCVVAL
jgi:hypothetical protein